MTTCKCETNYRILYPPISDALSTALSALYAKVLVIMGIAMPVAEILSNQIPMKIYQGFYFFLYLGSIFFVCFVYASHMRTRAVFSIIKDYRKCQSVCQSAVRHGRRWARPRLWYMPNQC